MWDVLWGGMSLGLGGEEGSIRAGQDSSMASGVLLVAQLGGKPVLAAPELCLFYLIFILLSGSAQSSVG